MEGQWQDSQAAGFTLEGRLTVWVCAGNTGSGDGFGGGRQRGGGRGQWFARLVPRVVG